MYDKKIFSQYVNCIFFFIISFDEKKFITLIVKFIKLLFYALYYVYII